GQGAQWAGMGLDLWDSLPAFGERMDACAEALSRYVDWSLKEVLENGSEWFDRTDVVQPALFAVMVALAGAWRSVGVEPSVVVGHSQGEIAAAHVAGALSLDDAARVVALRSRAVADELAGHGGMAAIAAPVEDIEPRLRAWEGRVAVAVVNGPGSVVVAGDHESLDEVLSAVAEEGIRARKIPVDYASHSRQVERIRDRLLDELSPISPRSGEIPFVSSAVAGVVDGSRLDAEYWYRSLRDTVRFQDATSGLIQDGCGVFLEVSPHPVLTAAVEETAGERDDIVVLESLRRHEDGGRRFAASLAAAHVRGVEVDWRGVLGTGELVELPTYPFQRQRFWLSAAPGTVGQDHPWLGAAVGLAGTDEWVLTGRIGLSAHPWLADHAVGDAVLFPGTGFVELALAAGAQTECELLDELVLETPLVLPEHGWVDLQIQVREPDPEGRRELLIHARQDDAGEWTRHARGVLAPTTDAALSGPESWPPEGAEPIEIDSVYDRLADIGLPYGPGFQGLAAAWRHGEDLFAEVTLAEAQEAQRFAIHPALFDAALHPAAFDRGELRLPFSWSGVRLFESGASSLRVRITPAGRDAISLTATDPTGKLVLALEALTLRPPDLHDSLYRLEWNQLLPSHDPPPRIAVLGDLELDTPAERHPDLGALIAALDAGAPIPELVLTTPPHAHQDLIASAHHATQHTLTLLQHWLSDERLTNTRLALITTRAVAITNTETPNLHHAPLWGLLRSAQTEHPGRFTLIDLDHTPTPPHALTTPHPQLAIRNGTLHTPQLTRVSEEPTTAPALDPEGTVLVTGGTGGLGSLVARDLAQRGARRLLLASRRGEQAEGAQQLRADLAALGCEARVVACDVTDRPQLATLLDSIPDLTAVIHTAGVLDDGVIETLSPQQLERVLRPKLDAAVHLDHLTRDVREFVVFSSAAATLGNAGQANYAAANAFLDALAQHRRARGLPAVSLAWGPWGDSGGMSGALSDSDRSRMARAGMAPLPERDGIELFHRGRAGTEAVLLPLRLDTGALRAQARAGTLPPLLRGLVRPPTRRTANAAATLAQRLADTPANERDHVVLELVRAEVATVLGHSSPEAVEPERAFKELGFDSLGAVELRNRLGVATGLQLPSTLVFDHPSPKAVAGYLRSRIDGRRGEGDDDARIQQAIASIPIARLQQFGLLDTLLELADSTAEPVSEPERGIDDMDLEELVQSALRHSTEQARA
ncbi:MAG TPA: type I polyketide synthase, partial [Solirubrobacteraceae bacterium]|nr:type I polyketide synthase [Solirubrobacteraceae bacterium]